MPGGYAGGKEEEEEGIALYVVSLKRMHTFHYLEFYVLCRQKWAAGLACAYVRISCDIWMHTPHGVCM